jgi:hypothetical protein
VLEDVHWADEMSLRLLAFVSRRIAAWPVLLVAKGELLLQRSVADAPQAERGLPAGPLRGPSTAGQVVKAACGDEPGSPLAAAGKRAAAYDVLAPIYGWFTEGFDLADFREAWALLEQP